LGKIALEIVIFVHAVCSVIAFDPQHETRTGIVIRFLNGKHEILKTRYTLA
jgi:hypothetical protein